MHPGVAYADSNSEGTASLQPTTLMLTQLLYVFVKLIRTASKLMNHFTPLHSLPRLLVCMCEVIFSFSNSFSFCIMFSVFWLEKHKSLYFKTLFPSNSLNFALIVKTLTLRTSCDFDTPNFFRTLYYILGVNEKSKEESLVQP